MSWGGGAVFYFGGVISHWGAKPVTETEVGMTKTHFSKLMASPLEAKAAKNLSKC